MASSINQGAINDSSESIIRKHLSPAFKGTNWDALIAAIAAGDSFIRDLGQKVYKQLFKSTASGKYLDRKASDDGFTRPFGVGLSDDVFRKLAITINAEKLTLQSFLQVLETYYGPDALRATVDSTTQTYNLQDNDDLLIKIDGISLTIIFKNTDFQHVGFATALEVASAINRYFDKFKLSAFALSIKDATTGLSFIRIYSGALGLRGTIQILGGNAQNKLLFPTSISTTQTVGTQWKVDNSTSLSSLQSDKIRFTWIGGTDPSLKLLKIGDYANIYGSPFNSANRGAYVITAITTTYFEITNLNGVIQGTVTQTAQNDVAFYNPTIKTINDNFRVSFAAQGNLNYADVFFAATTQAVQRTVNEAAYLHSNDPVNIIQGISSSGTGNISRAANVVTVITDQNHNLNLGMTIYLASGEAEFPAGVKTVTNIINPTTFTYSETGNAVSSTRRQNIYLNFRNSNGTVTITSSSNHNLVSNQNVIIDSIYPFSNTAPARYFRNVTAGSFVALNFMNAVLLNNGNILACGGETGGHTKQNTAVTYTESTDTWTALANMNDARSEHSLTLLSNGRVLAAGGDAVGKSAEIYDPTSNAWIKTLQMANVRNSHTSTLLNDGRVLVVGGGTATAEIYSTTSGWSTVAAPSLSRKYASATKLGDGRVLVVGGTSGGGTSFQSAEIYNPNNDSWFTTANMSAKRYGHKAILIPELGTSGMVMVCGGIDDVGNVLNSAEFYNPATNTWTTKSPMPTTLAFFALTRLHTDEILINGGQTNGGGTLAGSSIYNFYNDTWYSNFSQSTQSRYTHFAIKLPSNRVVLTSSATGAGVSDAFNLPAKVFESGGMNGLFTITVTQPNQFTFQTNQNLNFKADTVMVGTADSKVYPIKASSDSSHRGPYILNPNLGPAITSFNTTITQTINKDNNYTTLSVTDASLFPSKGFLVFDFGGPNELFPVEYVLKVNSNLLILNSAYTFPLNLPNGTRINVLQTKGNWIPDISSKAGLFYLTDSISGRIAAQDTINKIAAVGATINETILYPSDIGLGNNNYPVKGNKVSDKVYVWGSEQDLTDAREN